MDRVVHRLTVRRPARGDEGFTLVEVTISLFLLALVLGSALSLFVRALNNVDVQAQRQQAITIANQQLEKVRALPVESLVDGRTAASVTALWGWDANLTSLSVMASDPTAVTGSVPVIKPVDPLDKTKYDNVSYTMRTYIDVCHLTAPPANDCGKTSSSTTKPMYRITVSVAWSPRGTRTCDTKKVDTSKPNDLCQEYVVSTLRDLSDDATFNTN